MSGVLYGPQFFAADEVVYESGDTNCDALYFVEEGKVQVQALVTISQETMIPTSRTDWERTRTEIDVLYFVKQINAGGFFGLDELVDIAQLRAEGKHGEASQVKRKLKVSTMSNCRISYMTATSFMRLFGKHELETMAYFKTPVDYEDIKNRIRSHWLHKRELHKRLGDAVGKATEDRKNRLAPWV